MPQKCVAMFCSNTSRPGISLHTFPKDPHYRRLWTQFVQFKRANFNIPGPNSSAVLCSEHFSNDSFENYTLDLDVRFSIKRKLKKNAVPTINAEAVCASTLTAVKRPASSEGTAAHDRKRSTVHKRELARVCLTYFKKIHFSHLL